MSRLTRSALIGTALAVSLALVSKPVDATPVLNAHGTAQVTSDNAAVYVKNIGAANAATPLTLPLPIGVSRSFSVVSGSSHDLRQFQLTFTWSTGGTISLFRCDVNVIINTGACASGTKYVLSPVSGAPLTISAALPAGGAFYFFIGLSLGGPITIDGIGNTSSLITGTTNS